MFTVQNLSDLRTAVRYAAPHADKIDDVSVLSGINFRTTKGSTEVTVSATDRYTLAMIPVPLSDPAPDDVNLTLPAKELVALLKPLKTGKGRAAVSERADSRFVHVEAFDANIAPYALLALDGEFPRNLETIVPTETGALESVAFNPTHMARFAPARWPGLPTGGTPRVDLTFATHAPHAPIRVTVPDLPGMVALVIPIRHNA